MYLPFDASRIRLREAADARRNRLDIVKALSLGEISKRDLFKWGLLTGSGLLVRKHGLSPWATSAHAQVPTGTPRSPVPPGLKFTQPLPRAIVQKPLPLIARNYVDEISGKTSRGYAFCAPGSRTPMTGVPDARQSSYHTYFSNGGHYRDAKKKVVSCANPVTDMGPMEGRPPRRPDGDWFAHQRWSELTPRVGYLMSIGQIKSGQSFHPALPHQAANSVWSFGSRYGAAFEATPGSDTGKKPGYYGYRTGEMAPPLFVLRYGEPVVCRIRNDLPCDRAANGGFGRNEISTHYHNAHNGAESDGASNAYHLPGTFYDYLWSSMLARRDMVATPNRMDPDFKPNDPRASTIDDHGRAVRIPGDHREIQGSMWLHDHRFFFTAENVHKGMFGLVQMHSGPDRGNEEISDGVNLRLPSGIGSATGRAWGNLDYDVYLAISNPALDQGGQLFFDIFDTDGFLGDILAVNGAYYPFLEVKARRYRFRILNASMSRFVQLALVDQNGTPVPFHVIANDGNLLPKPVLISNGVLDQMGVGERFDLVVDFKIARSRGSSRLYLVNLLRQTDGRKPDKTLSIRDAIKGVDSDPAVGKILEFRVGDIARDLSADLFAPEWQPSGARQLTQQIPVQAPVRVRTIEYKRSEGDSRNTADGQCIPDCGSAENFPWSIRIDGEATHSFNATRISALVPKPGEIEHWHLVNGGGGWDHPIHLHFEEAVTIDRGGAPVAETERLARKDVWRLRPSGSVRVQVRFGEFGGAYVSHCHNTVHEDFAMLMRYQLLRDGSSNGDGTVDPQWRVSPTPLPTPLGVAWKDSEILPEGDPRTRKSG